MIISLSWIRLGNVFARQNIECVRCVLHNSGVPNLAKPQRQHRVSIYTLVRPLSFLFNHLIQLAQWIFSARFVGRTHVIGAQFRSVWPFPHCLLNIICPPSSDVMRLAIYYFTLYAASVFQGGKQEEELGGSMDLLLCNARSQWCSCTQTLAQPPSAWNSTLLATLAIFPTRDICLINFGNWASAPQHQIINFAHNLLCFVLPKHHTLSKTICKMRTQVFDRSAPKPLALAIENSSLLLIARATLHCHSLA